MQIFTRLGFIGIHQGNVNTGLIIINVVIIRKLSKEIRQFKETGSTNEELVRLAEAEDLAEGTVILADWQSRGKGHQGNSWQSEPGKNLLFSLLLKPDPLPPDRAFHISRITCLSLVEVLDKHGINAVIKWPNDILTARGKICGILIENSIMGETISSSVIGVGLNINQDVFEVFNPPASSMTLEKVCHFDRMQILEEFRENLESWYQALLAGSGDTIMDAYHAKLYLVDEEAMYSDGKSEFRASIRGVLSGGELELETDEGEVRKYGFKEIEFLDLPA